MSSFFFPCKNILPLIIEENHKPFLVPYSHSMVFFKFLRAFLAIQTL